MTALLPPWEDLSLPQQIAQMIVVRASGHLFDHQIQYPQWEPPTAQLRHAIQSLGVGGVILLGASAVEVGLRSHQLQDWATVPLLIAADIEEGVGQRFSGATWFPPPMALGAIAQRDLPAALHYAEQMGAAIAQEALAVGINWLLAPVVDVNNNPLNPVINVRAFADSPDRVSQLSTAFLRGAQSYPVLTAAKHFPGHGDTAVDSHLTLPVLPHDRLRLESTELVPFQAAIAAGVDAVMTAHLHIPALDATDPATLSHPLLTGLLRQQMGFDGLVVTDALVMGAIANTYGVNEAPVLAVEAGADIVLMPGDVAGAIAALVEAVTLGRLSTARIHQSLDRIWRAKQKISTVTLEGSTSHGWEAIAPPPVALGELATPTTRHLSQNILRESLQVHLPPVPPSRHTNGSPTLQPVNLILVDDGLNCDFLPRQAPAIALPTRHGYRCQILDRHSPWFDHAPPTDPAPTLLQVFIRGNPFRNSAPLTQVAQHWLQHLLHADQLLGLVVYGSPYSLSTLTEHLPADIPYIFTYGQMPEAQAIALDLLLSAIAPALPAAPKGDRQFTT